MRYVIVLLLLAGMLLSTACAPGTDRYEDPKKPANFWHGLWHGLIVVITMVWQLFNPSIRIYEANNNGWPYDLGFVLAILCFFGSSKAGCKH